MRASLNFLLFPILLLILSAVSNPVKRQCQRSNLTNLTDAALATKVNMGARYRTNFAPLDIQKMYKLKKLHEVLLLNEDESYSILEPAISNILTNACKANESLSTLCDTDKILHYGIHKIIQEIAEQMRSSLSSADCLDPKKWLENAFIDKESLYEFLPYQG